MIMPCIICFPALYSRGGNYRRRPCDDTRLQAVSPDSHGDGSRRSCHFTHVRSCRPRGVGVGAKLGRQAVTSLSVFRRRGCLAGAHTGACTRHICGREIGRSNCRGGDVNKSTSGVVYLKIGSNPSHKSNRPGSYGRFGHGYGF